MNTLRHNQTRLFRLMFMVFLSLVLIALVFSYAFADSDDAKDVQNYFLEDNEITYIPGDDFPESDELFAGYVEREFYGESSVAAFSSRGSAVLNSTEYAIYEKLKANIAQVAAGMQSSTQWTFTASDLDGAKLSWTYVELGLDQGASVDEIKSAAKEVFNSEVSLSSLINVLSADCPYDMYWFDKTAGMGMSWSMTYSPGYSVSITQLSIGMYVSADYSSSGTQGTLLTNTEKTSATTKAVSNAKNIVSQHENENSSTKLTSYKTEICNLASYNYDAASDSVSYGDPWQLIYVFDNDSSTNVVCEGYSKAFQYLCDLTTWNDDTQCYSVWGTMSDGTVEGGHMWNVVIQDATNYLVDVTNSDEDSVGQNGDLFMVTASSSNCTSSSPQGYTFTVGSNASTSITYVYDLAMASLYSDDILELISKTPLEDAVIAAINDQTYTGNAVQPSVSVALSGVALEAGSDYVVSYANNINAGTATVTITGKGNYTGTKTVTFKITAKILEDSMVGSSIVSQTYTGLALTPEVTVKNGGTTLASDIDYTVSYENNINVGTAKVIIIGLGNYTGTLARTFTINACPMSSVTISSIPNQTYTGTALEPAVTVALGGILLTSGIDYGFEYANNTNAGTATITITGMGNYTGSVKTEFAIAAKRFSLDTVVALSYKSKEYTGSAFTPEVTVKDGSMMLTIGSDYTVSYKDNTNTGTATVTITGIGNYTGSVTATFAITARSIEDANVSSIADQAFTGSVVEPSVSVSLGGVALKVDTDYVVSYENNTSAGTATATITGKGNYTGRISKTFKISAANISKAKVAIKAQTYTGKSLTPNPTVKVGGITLKKNIDYVLNYKNNKKTGKATVIITGKGNYTGSVSKTFNIVPAKVTNVKASSTAKGKVNVRWSNTKGKAANVTGYKIVIKYGSKTIKTSYVPGKSSKSKTITVTSKYRGKKVKVYVYAYKTINKVKVCSVASVASKVRVKL